MQLWTTEPSATPLPSALRILAVLLACGLALACRPSVSIAEQGPHGVFVDLPTQELAPICRTSGNRIVVAFAHPPGYAEPVPSETVRSIVRRMNWKISDQSSQSSSGQRAARMAVDCTVGNAIQVHEIEVTNYKSATIQEAARKTLYGYPSTEDQAPAGTDAVKYLIFAPKGGEYGITQLREGYAVGHKLDAVKSRLNQNATTTALTVIGGGPAGWGEHTAIHELFHALGATQGGFKQTSPLAPYSSYLGHCVDGTDIMCYEDGSGHAPWGTYTWTRCPYETYATPVKVPIDCGSDTYFDAAPEPGSWLAEYWNLAGRENPYLSAVPTAAVSAVTNPATSVTSRKAILEGAVTPNGDYAFYKFEYGTTTAYGASAPVAGSSKTPGAMVGVTGYGDSPVSVSAQLSGLTPNTTYHYRIIAKNDGGQVVTGADKVFTTTRAPIAVTEAALLDPENPTGATLRGTVDANGLPTTYQFEYGTTTAYGEKAPVPAKDVTSGALEGGLWHVKVPVSGLKEGTTYHARLVATNQDGSGDVGQDITFKTPSQLPKIFPATNVTSTSATLRGTYDFMGVTGVDLAAYLFEYGTTENYGSRAGITIFPGGGVGFVEAETTLQDLKPNTTYHFRLVAGTEKPIVRYNSPDEVFTTTTISTNPATGIDATHATLHGLVNPEGVETTYHFEYDTSPYDASQGPHGTSVPMPSASIGSGFENVAVEETLSGLEPATEYHYRVVAKNANGTHYGGDQAFTTWGNWTTHATVDPKADATEASLEAVSCKSSVCVAAGRDAEEDKAFGELWLGGQWVSLFNESGFSGTPKDVSCTSVSSCLVVGDDPSEKAVVERWSAAFGMWESPGLWGRTELPPVSPAGASTFGLEGVSCTAANACTAVGWYVKEGTRRPLVERWNGSSWSVQETPSPGTGNADLRGVSCASATFCMAVGLIGSQSFAMTWNGVSWSLSNVAVPAGASSSALTEVSCTSTTSCHTVGSYKESSGYRKTLAETWNGSTWSVVSTPNPSGAKGANLLGISCSAANACIASGYYNTVLTENSELLVAERKTLAQVWDGSKWAIQSSPNPSGRAISALNAVSCVSAASCHAVGSAQTSAGGTEMVTLGARYD
ncbi:MAG TPA: hypothetical protein VFU04_03265 [Solirubrobacterales bacterium]|nr:hypothetical protein [Solirubrobacterales bacterium]